MKKKIVISSILTIAICLSLIIGSSFALFTSEAELNVTVGSATVKIEAKADETAMKVYSFDDYEHANTFENGGTAQFANSTLTLDRMTPGDKVVLPIQIKNSSDVKTAYRVQLVSAGADDGSVDLTGALTATITVDGVAYAVTGATTKTSDWVALDIGTDADFTLTVEFPNGTPENDNPFQNAKANLTITIEAVQGNGTDLY